MKLESLLHHFLTLIFLILPTIAWSQTSAIPWSSFSGGFGAASSTNTNVQSSTGEIAGTAQGGNTIVKSGFLVVRLQPGSVTAIDVTESLPITYALWQNYPNPFNPTTTIRFALPQTTEVRLVVYDLQGREVARLAAGRREPGYHSVTWNGRDRRGKEAPTGIYIARLVTAVYAKSIKLILLK